MKLILIIPVLSILSVNMAAAQRKLPTFDVQGHRGARGLMPENTIPAFLLAMNAGVSTLEMDLAITKDNKIIVSHEPWMSAEICANPSGLSFTTQQEKDFNIFEMTYEQVKQFDCGSKGHPRFPEQQHVAVFKPLLTDVIIAVEDHIKNVTHFEVDYNIEIKSSKEGDGKFHPPPDVFSAMVYDLLDQYLPMERVIIQSFDFRVLQYWHENYPDIRLAALVEDKRPIEAHLNELGFEPQIYSPDHKLLTRKKVEYLHAKKIKVIPWTVNEIGEMLAMKGMGVDGFITDYPNRAKQFVHTLNIVPKDQR